MRVIGKDTLTRFYEKHRDAKGPLLRWLKIAEASAWSSFADLKRTLGSADLYTQGGQHYVIFNIGGNKYRLVTAINFKGQIVVIEIVMVHTEYSKNRWKGKL
jgi:mRNA interferase HigB